MIHMMEHQKLIVRCQQNTEETRSVKVSHQELRFCMGDSNYQILDKKTEIPIE